MTRLRLVLVLSLLLSAAWICQPASASGFVHVSGQQLVDGDGQRLQLRGVAVGDWLMQELQLEGAAAGTLGMTQSLNRLAKVIGQPATDQFRADYQSALIGPADFTAMAAYGFNSVRVPFNARYLSDQLPLLDQTITWARAAGLYVILDMHAAPCSQNPYKTADSVDGTAQLWMSASCKAMTVAAWQTIAARYANDPAVLGYDLLNEPDGLAMKGPALVDMYQQIISAIRSVDPRHVVIVEGRSYTHDPSMFTAPLDPNLMLSLHQYIWDVSGMRLGPQIRSAENAAVKLGGVPVWIGEMGLSNDAAGVRTQVKTYNSDPAIAGWCYWTWKMAKRTDSRHGLVEYQPPASWIPVANWISGSGGATKPTALQANIGIAALLNAIAYTSPSTAVLSVLK